MNIADIGAKTASGINTKESASTPGSAGANSSKSNSQKAQTGLNADFNHFITMLLTQLKNQDPTNPMESNEFTQQIVAFTGVEQAVKTNEHLEELIKLNQGSQYTQGAMFIGKTIKYNESNATMKNGSGANFTYTLEEPENDKQIQSTVIRILDSQNRIVHETPNGQLTPGTHSFTWDGIKSALTKEKFPDGDYTIQVESYDNEGGSVKVGPSIHEGKVTEARVENGTMSLLLENGKKILINKVISITEDQKQQQAEISKQLSDKIMSELKEKVN